MKWKIIFLVLFILKAALVVPAHGQELNEIEDEDELERLLKDNKMDGMNCTGTNGCRHNCPLGRMRDEKGCFTCGCRKSGFFSKDIIIAEDTYDEYFANYDVSGMTRVKRGANKRGYKMWPKTDTNVYVPYMINKKLAKVKSLRIAISKAISDYNKRTCIRLIPRKAQRSYVEFKLASKYTCASYLGKVGRQQSILLGRKCRSHGTIIHEIMHALGVDHEQTRPDRDQYVKIFWNNIDDKLMYAKRRRDIWSSYGTPYDYLSVMHYGSYEGSKNGKLTMLTLKNKKIRTQNQFSLMDLIQLNRMYKCPDRYLKAAEKEAGGNECANRHKHCDKLVEVKTCNDSKNKTFMKIMCKEACGFCTSKNKKIEKIKKDKN